MYESPITQNIVDIASQVVQAQDGSLVYEVRKAIGYEINKEELIKALRYDRDQYQKGYEDGRRDSEWIPTSERLPQETDEYLVTTLFDIGAGKKGKGIYVRSFYTTSGKWSGLCDGEEVVAWRHLPEPYKEISE